MRNVGTIVSLLALSLLVGSVSPATAITKGERNIARSHAGGSAAADPIKVPAPREEVKDESSRAMPSKGMFETETGHSTKSTTRKIYHSRSGGSASAQFVTIPSSK